MTGRFTDGKRRIARLVAIGLSNQQIGEYTHRSREAVRSAVQVLFDKSGMGTRLEFSIWYWAQFPEEIKNETFPLR